MDDRSPGAGVLPGAPLSDASDRPRSDKATWALGLGVVGLVLGFLLLFAVLTPAAIVCGVRALREIRVDPELTGRRRAWTGIGLAVVAPLLWLGVFVAFLADGIA